MSIIKLKPFKQPLTPRGARQAWRETAPAIRVGRYIFLDEITGEAAFENEAEVPVEDIRGQAAVIAKKVIDVLEQAGGSPRFLTELTLYVAREIPREDMISAGLVLSKFLGSIVHEATWIKFNFLRDEGVKLALRGTAILPGDKPAKSQTRTRYRVTESGRLKRAA
jgi:enamine deaminase RidA (YjgF/YER057c/UK114 family)